MKIVRRRPLPAPTRLAIAHLGRRMDEPQIGIAPLLESHPEAHCECDRDVAVLPAGDHLRKWKCSENSMNPRRARHKNLHDCKIVGNAASPIRSALQPFRRMVGRHGAELEERTNTPGEAARLAEIDQAR